MAIEFNNLSNNAGVRAKGNETSKTAGSAAAKTSAPVANTYTDKAEPSSVELSNTGKLMQALEEKIRQDSGVDQEKVDKFKSLVDSDQYQVDSSALAKDIFESERSLS